MFGFTYAQTADEIVNKHVTAIGGLDAWKNSMRYNHCHPDVKKDTLSKLLSKCENFRAMRLFTPNKSNTTS